MEEELITKRELLELTGISYGALYRWKRMKILPDEWFIRRSTFTGHETYLPREKVLARVNQVQELKHDMSLEEIAALFQPGISGEIQITAAEAVEYGIAVPPVINQYLAVSGHEGKFDFDALLELYIFAGLLSAGTVSRDEAYEIAAAATDADENIAEPMVCMFRKYGVSFCLTAGEVQKITFDPNAVKTAEISVNEQKSLLSALLKQKGVVV